jgi:hypothetical protein
LITPTRLVTWMRLEWVQGGTRCETTPWDGVEELIIPTKTNDLDRSKVTLDVKPHWRCEQVDYIKSWCRMDKDGRF